MIQIPDRDRALRVSPIDSQSSHNRDPTDINREPKEDKRRIDGDTAGLSF
jgi:hypothetical protein